MKKLIALLMIVSVLLAVGCRKEEPADMTPPKGAAQAAPTPTGPGGGGGGGGGGGAPAAAEMQTL